MVHRLHVGCFCPKPLYSCSPLQNNVSAEVGVLINMGALAVSQLLENAQDVGVHLTLETAAVENQVMQSQWQSWMELDLELWSRFLIIFNADVKRSVKSYLI
jgi:hypothetical protein